jgi:uncharacterized protein with beta-barrel porin domain
VAAAIAAGLIGALALLSPAMLSPSFAQDATWLAAPTITNPADGNLDFNANANWNPATSPGSATDTGTATFGVSSGANVSFSSQITQLGGFTFIAAASNYAFTLNNSVLAFNGNGIVINGGTAAITNNSGGFTQFFNGSTAGGATFTNNSSGFTEFNDTSTAGSAAITNNSGGFTGFSTNSTAGSATITNNGGLTGFNDRSSAGSATITNNSGGSTQFGQSGGTDTSSAGSATITNNGGGGTTFFASSTAGSAAITNSNGGFTLFIATSTAGTATFTSNNNGGTFFFNTSTAGGATFKNNSGGFTEFNDGSTAGGATFTNNSGGFTQFIHASTAGSATITNNSGGTVTFFDNSDGGTAHLINGAGGTIDFSGSTGPLGNGVLGVGSLAGSGTFIVSSTQRINVSGSLALTSGALYLVQVQGTNASQINVSGTTTLAGNVEVAVMSRLTQKTSYTILTSPGLNGTSFSGVSLEFANNFASNPVLSTVGNNVQLTLDPGLLSPILPGNAAANQVKVASAIDNGLLAGNNLSNAFSTIFNGSGNALLNNLTQLSGEIATASQQTTFDAMGQFMGLMTDPFFGRGGGLSGSGSVIGYAEEDVPASAYAASSKSTDAFAMVTKAAPSGGSGWGSRWSVWASTFGGSQSTDGNVAQGSNNTTSRIFGTAVGADYLISPTTLLGFALAGGGTNFSVVNGGSGRSDLFQAGVYLRHTNGPAYVSAALAYGWQDITTNRTVTVAGLDQLRAEFNANAFSGRLEGGYRFLTPVYGGLGVTPYAAAQFVTFDLPNYAEQATVGLNTFALSYGARNVTDPRSELGVRTDKSWAVSDGILTLRGRLAWAHDYDPGRSIAATFQTLPAGSFVVNGAAQASDAALSTASIEMKWKNGWSAAATVEGEFSAVTNSYAGKAVVRYVW